MNKLALLSILDSEKHAETIEKLERFADSSNVAIYQDAYDYAKRADISHFQISFRSISSVFIDTFILDRDILGADGGFIVDKEEILYNGEAYHLINWLESHPSLISKDALNNHEFYIVYFSGRCTNTVYQSKLEAIKDVISEYNYSSWGSARFGDYEVCYNNNTETFDVETEHEINKFETSEEAAKFLNNEV